MIRTRRIRQGLLKIRISLDQLLVKAAFEVAKFLFKRGIILGTVYTILETRREWKTIKKHRPIETLQQEDTLSRNRYADIAYFATLLEPARNNRGSKITNVVKRRNNHEISTYPLDQPL